LKNPISILFLATIVLGVTTPLVNAQLPEKVSATLQNGIWNVPLNKQIQITADVTNGQDRDQPFAYIVQIKDKNGVVIQVSWLTGTLTPGQSLNPSQSWAPAASGSYTAEIYVWTSIDNPDALSPPLSMNISVT
jgi:hypothetical protein